MAVETALVVDDSKSARIMLSRLVQKNGLEVTMVESGEDAIAYLADSSLPDVIFMDHMMPGMDGLETTRQISQNPLTAHIPILMYTSKEGPEYEEEMLASGAYGMLGKPAKPDRLASLIQELNERPSTETAAVDPGELELAAAPEETTPEEVEPAAEALEIDDLPAAADNQTTEAPISSPEEEEEEMSQEMIEEVSSKLIARAIEDALQPVSDALHRLETSIHENQSEIRKLNARQDQNVNHVSQTVLDASLKQTGVQFQNQITAEIKAVRDLIDSREDLSPAAMQQIKDIASETAAEAGIATAEKTASSAAEAVAAKVSAAQAQIQVQQDLQPYFAQAKKSNTIAVVSMVIAIAAIASHFLL